MAQPLNPQLYTALTREFAHVSITSEGIAYNRSSTAGEYYKVNCPQCGDSRQRLWINHMFGVDTGDGDNHLYLSCCYNEHCYRTLQDRRDLWNRLFPFNYSERLRVSQIRQGVQLEISLDPVVADHDMPLQAPWDSPEALAGMQYLQGRGFDVCELWSNWNVYIASMCDRSQPSIPGRVVIPVRRRVASLLSNPTFPLVGWQARAVRHEYRKYLCMQGFSKSKSLYGVERAKINPGPIVVVEGPSDVWRFGGNALGLMGKCASDYQVDQLVTDFLDRPIAVALDRDANHEAQELARKLQLRRSQWGCPHPVALVSPPTSFKDFAECSRIQAWEWVANQFGPTTEFFSGADSINSHHSSTVIDSVQSPEIVI